MQRHTPGPWRAEHTWSGLIVVRDAAGHTVATIEKYGLGDHANGVAGAGANAELIAACPALRTVADAAADLLRVLDAQGRFQSWRAVGELRAALELLNRAAP